MHHHAIRVLSAHLHDARPADAPRPDSKHLVATRIDVEEGSPATGWPIRVTLPDGRSLPAILEEASLLEDYLDYLHLPDDVVVYHGTAREQLHDSRPR